jgi:hypothetical protein
MSEPHPEHPIVLPPDTPDDAHPEHPIVLPDEETPEVAEELSFFQRTTLGFNWEIAWLGDENSPVFIDAWVDDPAADGGGTWRNVRTVLNDGSSSVTYASDFSGPVKIRCRGESGSVSGSATVT